MSNRQRKIALFDLDGTLVEAHLWLGLTKYNLKFKKNIFETYWYILRNIMITPLWILRLITKEEYYRSWGENVSQMIKGVEVSSIKNLLNWLSDEYLLPTVKKNTFERLRRHQKERCLTVLTSGSFEDLLKIIASRLKIDFATGTKLEINKNKFTGRIVQPFCFGRGKAEKVKSLIEEKNLNVDLKESYAYSDSIFDLPMLELVGHPVVVDPDKKLLKIARNKNWEILL